MTLNIDTGMPDPDSWPKQPTKSLALELAERFDKLWIVDKLETGEDLAMATAAELRRLAQQEAALKEWFSKTDWVRPTLQPSELGMHIADVLKNRLASVESELAALKKALRGLEPVAWGAKNGYGKIVAAIPPDKHRLERGAYTVDLYTLPPNLKG